ncbi:hypothetical protein WG68_00900 [Arsukibacterium ikkense]|uniref:Uncharacterized protein n=1 Tax=Arsukibacterium ikkense TaxID=336831 RepID=A0A0M2V9X8_9GAMM|nr:hypothetical protein [Arsukibacterium ikkense]KKO47239.1 hypothetical protein WG68_00900 [Arsukibacterium ikkense]
MPAAPIAAGYAAWLIQARQALSQQQHLTTTTFSADSTTVCFDNISYATVRVTSEQSAKQE